MNTIMMKLAEHAYMNKEATKGLLLFKGLANALKPIVKPLLKGNMPEAGAGKASMNKILSIANLRGRELAATQGMSDPSFMKSLAKSPARSRAYADFAEGVGRRIPKLTKPATTAANVFRSNAGVHEKMYRDIASGKNPIDGVINAATPSPMFTRDLASVRANARYVPRRMGAPNMHGVSRFGGYDKKLDLYA